MGRHQQIRSGGDVPIVLPALPYGGGFHGSGEIRPTSGRPSVTPERSRHHPRQILDETLGVGCPVRQGVPQDLDVADRRRIRRSPRTRAPASVRPARHGWERPARRARRWRSPAAGGRYRSAEAAAPSLSRCRDGSRRPCHGTRPSHWIRSPSPAVWSSVRRPSASGPLCLTETATVRDGNAHFRGHPLRRRESTTASVAGACGQPVLFLRNPRVQDGRPQVIHSLCPRTSPPAGLPRRPHTCFALSRER